MIRNFVWVLFLGLVCGARAAQPAAGFRDSAGRQFLIMPASSLDDARRTFQKEKDTHWPVSADEAKKAANLILAALTRGKDDPTFIGYARDDWRFEYVAGKIGEVISQYPSYACQVIGLQEGGHKYIAFNFFPAEELPSSRNPDSVFVGALDGGAWYWRIEFDLTEKKIVRFVAHGDA